ncbi:unnamed protein product [Sphagnum compactum]
MDIYHLTQEIDATDMTALEVVTNVDEEWLKLEKEEAELLAAQGLTYYSHVVLWEFEALGSLVIYWQMSKSVEPLVEAQNVGRFGF